MSKLLKISEEERKARRKAQNKIAVTKWRTKHPEYFSEYNKKYRPDQSEYMKKYYTENKERFSKYYEINKEYKSEYDKKYRAENIEKVKERSKNWRQKNIDKCIAANRKREIAKIQRVPKWADLEKIKVFYLEANRLTKETGIKYHVDHIVPLRGKKVSGLHVETNLQVIPAVENIRKNNKFGE